MNFAEKVIAIEDAAIKVVEEGMPYVQTIATYGGELSDINTAKGRENLKEVVNQRIVNGPTVLISYSGGQPALDGAPLVIDEPREVEHAFTIAFVALTKSTRSEVIRRRGIQTANPAGNEFGTYKMVSDFYDLFTARQLVARIDNQDVILNEGELIPVQDGFLTRVPGVTAHALPFTGSFRFVTSGRSQNEPVEINTINFDIGSLNGPHGAPPLPGVEVEKE
jgi:hypothetical protein